MKRLLAMAAATAVLGFAAVAPASAQSVTGTLNITGTVAGNCAVINGPAGFTSTSFSGLYTFPTDLADPTTGQLRSSISNITTAAGTPVTLSGEVVCNTGTPKVTLQVVPLFDGDASPQSGYSGTIDFTGEVDITTTGGTTAITQSTTGTNNQANGNTTTPANMTAPLSVTNPNVVLYAYNFATRGGPVLEAGTYNGFVKVTIAPQ